ncbi:response regulator [Thalassotalea sp. PLHSN55]|uniref:response regulator n=1 Tax=Thalassotalea sp. PLHSN55 TaxID=3435888 RepID=UPI003F844F31
MDLSVLICDDSNLARKQVLRSLPEDYRDGVQLVTNGQEAVDVLRSQKIDVLFLDLTMPVLDGVGVLEVIQKEAIECCVFVISADVQPEMQKKVLALGARAFLSKPVKPEILLEHIQELAVL